MRNALLRAKLVRMHVYDAEIRMKISESEEALAVLRDRKLRKVLTIHQAQNLSLQVGQ